MFSRNHFTPHFTPLRPEHVGHIFSTIVDTADDFNGVNPASIDWRVKYNPRAHRMILRYQQGVATITLPRFAGHQHVKKFLQHSVDWLQQEVAKEKHFAQYHDLLSGKNITIMGHKKLLHFVTGNGRVKENAQEIIVPGNDQPTQQQKLKKYLWRVAERDFPAVVDHYCRKLQMATPQISIRDPKTRWGSCIRKKRPLQDEETRIMLSFRLTLAPPLVLAYLAAHEVCHLREANHGKRFWDLVEKLFPEYQVAEKWLKTDGKNLMRLF
ncbi:MAG: SprT family zinc-dependent metalloprotease [Hydrotalea sp.]|nr:SprT family zinc-dependent metalloprotease [Hydrotalea sp.]